MLFRIRARGVSALALLAAALAGCGADADAMQARTTAGDKRLAKASVLTLRDLPPGWTQAERAQRQVTCDAYADARRRASGIGYSPTFSKTSDTQVSTAVYLFADAAAARRAFAAIAAPATRRCYATELSDSLARNGAANVGPTRSSRLAPARVGDQRAGARFAVALEHEGTDIDLFVDLVYVRTGRALSLAGFINVSTAFDAKLRTRLTAKQVSRLPS